MEIKKGIIRSSLISKFIDSKDSKDFTDSAKKMLKEILFETISGNSRKSFIKLDNSNESHSSAWGLKYEKEAIDYYCKLKNVKGHKPNHKDYDILSGCCDYKINDLNYLLEIKCPFDPTVHMGNIKKKKVIKTANDQIQTYLFLYDCEYCDFISYDPRMTDMFKMKVIRVYRDKDFKLKIDKMLKNCKDYMNEEYKLLKKGINQ